MKVVFWDFDGTLAERPGRWGRCLADIAARLFPSVSIDRHQLRAALSHGFPWHEPTTAHPHLNEPDLWWAALHPTLERACLAAGLDNDQSKAVSREARQCYSAPGSFHLYPDSRPALEALRAAGWRHAILSNHVPELPAIVADLGISKLIDEIFTSASTGFDKPHPKAFTTALDALRPQEAWMIGDNPHADIAGANSVGLPAMLVSRDRSTSPLLHAAGIILSQSPFEGCDESLFHEGIAHKGRWRTTDIGHQPILRGRHLDGTPPSELPDCLSAAPCPEYDVAGPEHLRMC
jgi:putative hydrolase of the HAD superfamily